MNTRHKDLLSNRERMKNELEVKLLLKNVRINNNIIDSRNKARADLYNKFKKREKRIKDAKIISELIILKKIDSIKQRQMSRDIRDIKYRFKLINPMINDGGVVGSSPGYDDDISKINNKVNYYSMNRRKYIDEIKNKFYDKNSSLKKIMIIYMMN